MARKHQKHGVPALMSFFIPGLGQLTKGHIGKALIAFFGTIIGTFLLVFPGIFVWLWNIYDAYNSN
ncbi:hypothetical protein HNV12_02125 [Methanococcoides sp. SA1]|nr:hypothetical protein [Methanococcoides sp. SA1]